jgi:hypothetical protein
LIEYLQEETRLLKEQQGDGQIVLTASPLSKTADRHVVDETAPEAARDVRATGSQFLAVVKEELFKVAVVIAIPTT